MMLRSYSLSQFGAPLALIEKPEPQPIGREVVIRIEACGVCHSDLHIFEGYFDLGDGKTLTPANNGRCLPMTMGHEIAGTVIAVGPEAIGVTLGQRMAVFPWIGCGECLACRSGQEHICSGAARALGIFVDGGYATHVVVPDPKYLVNADGLPADAAAILACSGLTAYSALKKAQADDIKGEVLIIGAGGVGLSAVQFCQPVLNRSAYVAEPNAAKRQAALEAGAKAAFDPMAEGERKRLYKETGGGFAAIIDFAGTPESTDFALSLLQKGGRFVVVGLLGGTLRTSIPLLAMRAISIQGSYVGSLKEFAELVALARQTGLPRIPLEHRPLAEVNRALADLKAGSVVGRVVLDPA